MAKVKRAQQDLSLPVAEKVPTRGGKRAGAGRPKQGVLASERHERRAFLESSEPVHVTIRVVRAIRDLRRPKLYRAIRAATIKAYARGRFRIVHMSIQDTHVHLIVEANNRTALARGMQGFEVSAARRINRMLGRRGTVFADRYHPHILRTPREARHAINYVLNNWRKHGADHGAWWRIDPFSSGYAFGGWVELLNSPSLFPTPRGYEPLSTFPPTTWLLKAGWRRHGLISTKERPGAAVG